MMFIFLLEKGGQRPIDQCPKSRVLGYEVSVMSQPGQQHGLPGLPVPGTNW
jgi:hypothetical protein